MLMEPSGGQVGRSRDGIASLAAAVDSKAPVGSQHSCSFPDWKRDLNL